MKIEESTGLRACILAALIFAVYSRYNGLSFVYLLFLLVLPWTRWHSLYMFMAYTAPLLVFSFASLVAQGTFYLIAATDSAMECSWEVFWRQLGLNSRLTPSLLLPDIVLVSVCFVACLFGVMSSSCFRHPDRLSGISLPSYVRYLLQVGNAVLVLATAISSPSLLSGAYLLTFVSDLALWAVAERRLLLRIGRLWLIVTAYACLHLCCHYLYQLPSVNRLLPEDSAAARLLGLRHLFRMRCRVSDIERSDTANAGHFVQPPLLVATYITTCLLGTWDSSQRRRHQPAIDPLASTTDASAIFSEQPRVLKHKRRASSSLRLYFAFATVRFVFYQVAFLLVPLACLAWSLAFENFASLPLLLVKCVLLAGPNTRRTALVAAPLLAAYCCCLLFGTYAQSVVSIGFLDVVDSSTGWSATGKMVTRVVLCCCLLVCSGRLRRRDVWRRGAKQVPFHLGAVSFADADFEHHVQRIVLLRAAYNLAVVHKQPCRLLFHCTFVLCFLCKLLAVAMPPSDLYACGMALLAVFFGSGCLFWRQQLNIWFKISITFAIVSLLLQYTCQLEPLAGWLDGTVPPVLLRMLRLQKLPTVWQLNPVCVLYVDILFWKNFKPPFEYFENLWRRDPDAPREAADRQNQLKRQKEKLRAFACKQFILLHLEKVAAFTILFLLTRHPNGTEFDLRHVLLAIGLTFFIYKPRTFARWFGLLSLLLLALSTIAAVPVLHSTASLTTTCTALQTDEDTSEQCEQSAPSLRQIGLGASAEESARNSVVLVLCSVLAFVVHFCLQRAEDENRSDRVLLPNRSLASFLRYCRQHFKQADALEESKKMWWIDHNFSCFLKWTCGLSANYGCYKLGIEATCIALVVCSFVRRDILSYVYLLLAIVVVGLDRWTLSKVWPLIQLLLSLVFVSQMLMACSLAPALSTDTQQDSWLTNLLTLTGLGLSGHQKVEKMLIDFVLLTIVNSQRRVFNIEAAKEEDIANGVVTDTSRWRVVQSPADHDANIQEPCPIHEIPWQMTYSNKPVYKDTIFSPFLKYSCLGQEHKYSDILSILHRFFLKHLFWITWNVVLLYSCYCIGLCSAYYICISVFYIFRGREFLLGNRAKLVQKCNLTLVLNLTLMLLKCQLQFLSASGSLRSPCWLFGVGCSSSPVIDILLFISLIIQKRVFQTRYFTDARLSMEVVSQFRGQRISFLIGTKQEGHDLLSRVNERRYARLKLEHLKEQVDEAQKPDHSLMLRGGCEEMFFPEMVDRRNYLAPGKRPQLYPDEERVARLNERRMLESGLAETLQDVVNSYRLATFGSVGKNRGSTVKMWLLLLLEDLAAESRMLWCQLQEMAADCRWRHLRRVLSLRPHRGPVEMDVDLGSLRMHNPITGPFTLRIDDERCLPDATHWLQVVHQIVQLVSLILEDLAVGVAFGMMVVYHFYRNNTASMFYPLAVFLWGCLCTPHAGRRFWLAVIWYTLVLAVFSSIRQLQCVQLLFKQNTALWDFLTVDLRLLCKNGRLELEVILLGWLLFVRKILIAKAKWASSMRTVEFIRDPTQGLNEETMKNMDKFVHVRQEVPCFEYESTIQMNLKWDFPSFLQSARHSRVLRPLIRCYRDMNSCNNPEPNEMYTWMFITEFASLLWIMYLLVQSLSYSEDYSFVRMKLPVKVQWLLTSMMVAQGIFMLLDRILYLYKRRYSKLMLHFVHVLLIHLMNHVFFEGFEEHKPARHIRLIFYSTKAAYFFFSATQIRYGYPDSVSGFFFSDKYGLVHLAYLKLYMLIPYLFELRCIVDWMCSHTCLTLSHWMAVENLYGISYTVKCWRVIDYSGPTLRATKRPLNERIFYAALYGIPIAICCMLPAFILSSTSVQAEQTENPVDYCWTEFSIVGHSQLYRKQSNQARKLTFNEVLTVHSCLSQCEGRSPCYSNLSLVVNDFEPYEVTMGSYSSQWWSVPPPALQELMDDLDSDKAVYTEMYIECFPSKHPKSKKRHITRRQMLPKEKQKLLEMLSATKPESMDPLILPAAATKYLKLLDKSQFMRPLSNDLSKQMNLSVELQIQPGKGHWWRLRDANAGDRSVCPRPHAQPPKPDELHDIKLFVFMQLMASDSFLPSAVRSFGTSFFFSFFFVTVAGGYRRGTVLQPFYILYSEMPHPDRILMLVSEIHAAREEKELDVEEYLVSKLLFLFRSPSLLLRYTEPPESVVRHFRTSVTLQKQNAP